MLRNLWYVVAPADHLGAALLPVTLLGHRFVAFRDDAGQPRLLSDICVHRGASLSAGKRVGDSVQCPYHGWRFGGDGICQHIPAQPDARIPGKARVDSYPMVERHGWVWAFLGDTPDAERPPLPDLGWVDDPEVRVVRGSFDWDVNWERVVENGLDFAHAPFVHGSSFGAQDRPEIEAFDVSTSDWQGDARMTMKRPVRKGWLRRLPTGEYVDAITRPGYHFSGPCATLEVISPNGARIHIVSAHVPVDANRTRTWWIMGRTFARSCLLDGRFRAANLRIFREDHAVLKRVRPERVPDTWQHEVSVKSDALQIAFRQQLHALKARGWEVRGRTDGDTATERAVTVIPCPARREVTSWAIAAESREAGDSPTMRGKQAADT